MGNYFKKVICSKIHCTFNIINLEIYIYFHVLDIYLYANLLDS